MDLFPRRYHSCLEDNVGEKNIHRLVVLLGRYYPALVCWQHQNTTKHVYLTRYAMTQPQTNPSSHTTPPACPT